MSTEEAGKRVRFAWVLVLLAAAGLVAAFRLKRIPETMSRAEALYDAVVAQQLIHGDGFTTRLMPLGGLGALRHHGRSVEPPWPSVHGFVLSQVRVAMFLPLFPVPQEALIAASLVPFAVLSVLLFGLLRAHVPPLAAGVAIVFFIALDPLSRLAISGVGLTGDALLFLLACILLSGRRPVATGIVLALLVLHRYSMAIFVPFALWAALRQTGRGHAVRVGFYAAALLIPFFVWSKIRTGMLFPSVGSSLWFQRTAPGVSPVHAAASLARQLATTPGEVVRVLVVASLVVVGIRQLWRTSATAKALALPLLTFVACFAAAALLLSRTGWSFVYLTPLVWLAAACGAFALLSRVTVARAARGAALAGIAIVLTAPEWLADRHRYHSHAPPPLDELPTRNEVIAFFASYDQGALMGGNRPWEIAPDLSMPTLALAESPAELPLLREAGFVPDLLYVPADLRFAGEGARPSGWLLWNEIVRERPERFDQYALAHTFSDGAVAYVRQGAAGPFCPRVGALDLVHAGDAIHLSDHFGPVETDGARGFSWLQGRSGSVTLLMCPGSAPARLILRTINKSTLRVSINGKELDVVRPYSDWSQPEWALGSLPASPDGAYSIRFEVDQDHSLALNALRLETR